MEGAGVTYRRRALVCVGVGLLLAVVSGGTARGAVQIVEVSPQLFAPGTVVTLRVAMTARAAGTEPAPLFMIPSGTWGDSPDALRCHEVGRAIEVGQTHWQAGTVEYEGIAYDGVLGESTFTIPAVAADTYRLAETTEARGTGCHVFTSIEVVSELPDTALPLVDATSGQPALLAVALALSLACGWRLMRRATGRT